MEGEPGPSKFSCPSCPLTFETRSERDSHVSNAHSGIYRCPICNDTFSDKSLRDKHTIKCKRIEKKRKNDDHNDSATKRKRTRWVDDNVEDTPFADEAFNSIYQRHWTSIRSHGFTGPNQEIVNCRWPRSEEDISPPSWRPALNTLFERQIHPFKINFSHSYILQHNETGAYRFFHASQNNARALDFPRLISTRRDLESFLSELENQDILQYAQQQRPDSKWSVRNVVSTSFYINPIWGFTIGCGQDPLPDSIRHNPFIHGLEKDRRSGRPYEDKLCLFRCLALHEGHGILALNRPTSVLASKFGLKKNFQGFTVQDLPTFENKFNVNIDVYEVHNEFPFCLRPIVRSRGKFTHNHMNVLRYKNHFCYITDINQAGKTFICSTCDRLYKRACELRKHQSSCRGRVVRQIYPGGVYHPHTRPLETLKQHGIDVPSADTYVYPFRATFDFESIQCPLGENDEKNQTHADNTRYLFEHKPLSVSVCSNVPGFQSPRCFVTDGDDQDLVNAMITYLNSISDEAFRLLSAGSFAKAYQDISELDDARETWGMNKQELKSMLDSYLHVLPTFGFNSSHYDFCLIKTSFFRHVLTEQENFCEENYDTDDIEEETRNDFDTNKRKTGPPDQKKKDLFMIKDGNCFKCVTTQKLKFLDARNYLAPNISYSQYLKGYGVTEQKSFFPFEYVNSLERLHDTGFPPREAFYSSLTKTLISEEDYQTCLQTWNDQKMTTLKDWLVFYNNLDVKPFLEALEKQVEFYRTLGIDMAKDAVGTPGIAMRFLFSSMKQGDFFSLVNEREKDMHQMMRDQIVGGASLVFTRYHEKDVTKIRYTENTTSCVLGFDCNALYLSAIMGPMPTHNPIRREKKNGFKPRVTDKYGQQSREWLEWLSYTENIHIRHKHNGKEQAVGRKKLRVDGFCGEKKTVYQFQGCLFHGHNCHLTRGHTHHPFNQKSMKDLWKHTQSINDYLRTSLGLTVVEMFECEWQEKKRENPSLRHFIETRCPPFHSALPWREISTAEILHSVQRGQLFGLVVCDISVPDRLKEHFSELQPIFKNTLVGRDDIGDHMKKHAEDNNLLSKPRRMLVASYFGKNICLITPLLRWYIDHGLEVSQVHQVIEYKPSNSFTEFGQTVTEARIQGDSDPNTKDISDSYKGIGNASYGKSATNLLRHNEIKYVRPHDSGHHINSPLFRKLTTLHEDLEEIELAKKKVVWDLPLSIATFVYQLSKLRLLQFHYDCIDKYISRDHYQLINCDTDSLYLSISRDRLEDVIKPEMRQEFFRNRHLWFPSESCPNHRDAFVKTKLRGEDWEGAELCCVQQRQRDARTPGLFKTEFQGEGMVALCSKTYFSFGKTQTKLSCKGLNKKQNALQKEHFMTVLRSGQSGGGTNTQIKTDGKKTYTYTQGRKALSYLYPKRRVQMDGINTLPTLV